MTDPRIEAAAPRPAVIYITGDVENEGRWRVTPWPSYLWQSEYVPRPDTADLIVRLKNQAGLQRHLAVACGNAQGGRWAAEHNRMADLLEEAVKAMEGK